MGLLAKSASFSRYAVNGDLPENFWDFAAERIAAHSFRDIDDSYEEQSIGWVSVLNMFDYTFTCAPYSAGDYIIMSLRIDERKVAARIINKFCLKEEEMIKKTRQIPKLSRAQRLEIKENITLMLTKKAVPAPVIYDLCWNLSTNRLLFFSTNQKAQEIIEEFFKKTFELSITLQVPYLAAEHLLSKEEQKALSEISPAIFV